MGVGVQMSQMKDLRGGRPSESTKKFDRDSLGTEARGLGVSDAARPTSSVPAKEKAAVTKTEQTPLKPFAKAPGLYHTRSS